MFIDRLKRLSKTKETPTNLMPTSLIPEISGEDVEKLLKSEKSPKLTKEIQNVMIDPSLLVAKRTVMKTMELVVNHLQSNIDCDFFIPKTFLEAIKIRKITKIDPLMSFYLQNTTPADTIYLRSELSRLSDKIKGYIPHEEYRSKHEEFKTSLLKQLQLYEFTRFYDVLNCLFEEWIFLQENSWIVSRTKKTFVTFKDAGGVYIEFGQNTIDNVIRKTLRLKEKNEILTTVQRLRAFGKWTAVGGSPLVALIDPIAGTLAGVASGFFLLFDP